LRPKTNGFDPEAARAGIERCSTRRQPAARSPAVHPIKKTNREGKMELSRRTALIGSTATALAAGPRLRRAHADASVTITLLTFESLPATQAVLKAHGAQFEALHPGVKVNINFSSGEALRTQVASMLQAGSAPDAVILALDDALLYSQNKLLEPVTDIVNSLGGIADRDRARLDGQDYYVPMGVKFTYSWYRKDLFEKAALEPPVKWDDMLKAAARFTGDGQYGFVVSSAETFDYPVSQLFSFAYSNGVNFVADDGTVTFDQGADRKGLVETLKFLKAMSKYSPNGANIQWGAAIDAYASGRVAMVNFVGARLLAIALQNNPSVGNATRPMPQPFNKSPGATMGPQGYMMFKGGAHKEITAEFIKFLSTRERILEFLWSTSLHVVPADKSVFEGDFQKNDFVRENPDIIKTIRECWDTGSSPVYDLSGKVPNWQRVRLYTSTTYNKMVANVIQGGMDEDAAVEQAGAAARKLLRRG
jgi:multiple sugar transport system substrate-binding protein